MSSLCQRLLLSKNAFHLRALHFSTTSHRADASENHVTLKTMADIPSYASSTLLVAIKLFRRQHEIHLAFDDGHKKYGPIYRFDLQGPTIVTNDPDAMATILRHEEKYPMRSPVPLWIETRKDEDVCLGVLLR